MKGHYFPVSSILKIAAYFLGTLVLGAILAPPLFWLGQAAGGWTPLHWLRETAFQRYFDRAMFLAALLLLWPAVHALHVRSWHDLDLRRDPRGWQHAGLGFVLAAGLLWGLGLCFWWERVYLPAESLSLATDGSFLLTAVAVGMIEEAFFRGAVLGLVRRTASPPVALAFVSALFAVLHFLKPPAHALPNAAVGWTAGFTFLPLTFWQFGDPLLVLGGFTTLFAVGWVLGWARLQTHALWLPIGLHAGWVFGLKTFSKRSHHLQAANWWIGQDLLHGIAPVAVVLLTGGLLAVTLQKRRTQNP
jgi:membrane protease YdiL (CAAX protease family)